MGPVLPCLPSKRAERRPEPPAGYLSWSHKGARIESRQFHNHFKVPHNAFNRRQSSFEKLKKEEEKIRFPTMFMNSIVLKDTERIWNAGVKAIPYFCKFNSEPRLLKNVFLQIEERILNILKFKLRR